jgi:hypothetical protein
MLLTGCAVETDHFPVAVAILAAMLLVGAGGWLWSNFQLAELRGIHAGALAAFEACTRERDHWYKKATSRDAALADTQRSPEAKSNERTPPRRVMVTLAGESDARVAVSHVAMLDPLASITLDPAKRVTKVFKRTALTPPNGTPAVGAPPVGMLGGAKSNTGATPRRAQ